MNAPRVVCSVCHCRVDVRARWQWEIDAGIDTGAARVHHMLPGTIAYNRDGVSLKSQGAKCPGSDQPATVSA